MVYCNSLTAMIVRCWRWIFTQVSILEDNHQRGVFNIHTYIRTKRQAFCSPVRQIDCLITRYTNFFYHFVTKINVVQFFHKFVLGILLMGRFYSKALWERWAVHHKRWDSDSFDETKSMKIWLIGWSGNKVAGFGLNACDEWLARRFEVCLYHMLLSRTEGSPV